ncbi:MAG: hypothetical protein JXA73_20935 [Acidobacteria bacterium]|nr:hypothetical protein [Acidobacteriota bacterium]
MPKEEPDFLLMMSRHELAVKQLYEIFAEMFPGRKSFWQSLVSDEQKHADWLEALRSDRVVCRLLLNEIGLKPQAIHTSIAYVESQIKRAQTGAFSVIQALSIARDLETAMIEKQFFKLSRSTSSEMRTAFKPFADETERHRQALIKEIGAERQRTS